jgi:hypothetical protein
MYIDNELTQESKGEEEEEEEEEQPRLDSGHDRDYCHLLKDAYVLQSMQGNEM